MSTTRRHALIATATAALAAALAGPAFAQAKLKVAAIYTVPVEQQWVSRIDKALKAAVARGEIEYVFSENVANADYERVMRQYAEAGHQLIVGESFAVEAAARRVAKDYPKTAFLMGSSGKPQAPNFAVFDNYIQEPAYLTGMIAGGMTKSNKIGMVGGYPIPEVNRLMNAFMAGAKEVNPKVEFTVTFINSWFDPAAKERKVLAIGNVIDTQAQYPDTVIASALWHMEPTIDTALKAVKAGQFKAEDYGKWSHMGVKGSSLSPLGTFEKRIPAELVAKVRAREKEILDGKFTVKIDDDQPKGSAR